MKPQDIEALVQALEALGKADSLDNVFTVTLSQEAWDALAEKAQMSEAVSNWSPQFAGKPRAIGVGGIELLRDPHA